MQQRPRLLPLLLAGVLFAPGAMASDTPVDLHAAASTSVGDQGFAFHFLSLGIDAHFGDHFRVDAHVQARVEGFELENAWIAAEKLPLDLVVRAGWLRSRAGVENERLDIESWFPDRPVTLGRFFGPDGLNAIGVDLSLKIPAPWDLAVWTAMTEGGGPGQRSGFRRGVEDIQSLRDFAYQVGLENSWSAGPGFVGFDLHAVLAPNDSGRGNSTDIYGAALWSTYRPDVEEVGFTLEAELLIRRQQIIADVLQDLAGWVQVMIWVDEAWSVGARWEYNEGLAQESGERERGEENRHLATVQVGYRPVQWALLRLAITADHLGDDDQRGYGGVLNLEVAWDTAADEEDE